MKTTIFLSIVILSVFVSGISYGQGTELIPGKPITVKILKGENHLYTITLRKGEYAECVVMQKGVDLAIDVNDPAGKKLKTIDSPNGIDGPEPISIEALQNGKYQLHIYPMNDQGQMPDSLKAKWADENQGDYAITDFTKLTAKAYSQKLAKMKADKGLFQEWVSNNAQEINTVDAGNGFEDLAPLKSVLKDVRVVGLGEATHGTSEFFRMKHRMLEFLVKDMGFSAFCIEASMSRCRYINDYVLYGKGSIDTATAVQGFWTWRTEEVKNMIEWLRQYNLSVTNEKKVIFFGFDMQMEDYAWKGLKFFYGKVNTKKSPELDTLKMLADSAQSSRFKAGHEIEGIAILNKAQLKARKMIADIVLNEGKYEFLTDKNTYSENLMNIKLIAEGIESQQGNQNEYSNLRDYYMAEHILYFLNREKPGAKIVVWAHNDHIAKSPLGPYLMGFNLSKVLKDEYYAIGFEFYSGSFQVRNIDNKNNLEVMSVGTPPVESLPWYFNQTGKNRLFIDFRNTGSNQISRFSQPFEMHDIGATYSSKWALTSPSILTNYDGMFYFKETTAAKGLNKVVIK
jgi:erythromycin esterase